MGREIERKFLVANDGWRLAGGEPTAIRQFYLADGAAASVRVRVKDHRDAVLTIKSRRHEIDRQEFEYAIPLADATALAELRDGLVIEKSRHPVRHGGRAWDVDVFAGAHAGLVLAEIELSSRDEAFQRPAWLGEEVTGDPRFYNRVLARSPGIPRM